MLKKNYHKMNSEFATSLKNIYERKYYQFQTQRALENLETAVMTGDKHLANKATSEFAHALILSTPIVIGGRQLQTDYEQWLTIANESCRLSIQQRKKRRDKKKGKK